MPKGGPVIDGLVPMMGLKEIEKALSTKELILNYDAKLVRESGLVPFLSRGFAPGAGPYQVLDKSGKIVASFQTIAGLSFWLSSPQ